MQSSILSWTCQISDCSEHVTQCFQKSGFRDLIKKLDPIVINFNLRVEHSPVEPWRLGFLFVSSNQGKLSDLKSSMKSCTKKPIVWNIPSSFDGLMGVVTCHFVRNHDLGSPPSLSLWEIRWWLHDWWQGPIQTYSLDPFSAQTLPAPRPNSHPVVNQWCSMSISRKTGIFGNSFKKLGNQKKTGIKKWQPKTGRHKNHGCFVAPAFSFVDPSLLFDVCCGLSQKFLATPKQITIIFSNHVLVGSCFLSYLWRHKKWFWWNRSVIYRSLKSPHLQSLCYIKTGMKLHISSNSWPPAPKTWTWQH